MILKKDNIDGYIQSYMEYDFVDENGKPDTEGKYLYVRDLWVHPDVSTEDEICKYIGELEHKYIDNKTITNVYWKRHKTGKMRVSRSYSRDLCVRKFIKFARRAQCYS